MQTEIAERRSSMPQGT